MTNFEEYVDGLNKKLSSLTTEPLVVKKINYGQQLVLVRGKEKVVLSIYNGKKGLKLVWGGVGGALQQAAAALLAGLPATLPAKDNTSTAVSLLTAYPNFDYLWAGSDESGKGDFFGPLVVAAVLLTKKEAEELLQLGVKDSKELKDDKISVLANKIKSIAPCHAILPLTPELYNKRYAELKAKGQNLNHLLTSGHVAALSKVLVQNSACHFALVDRFSPSNTIERDLKNKFPALTVVQQPKAEADMAVAAASILARAKFVEIMDELSHEVGMSLPKGGGEAATNCAKLLQERRGASVLPKLVKMHFANFTRL